MIERLRKRDLFVFVGETLLPANEYNKNVSRTMHADIMANIASIVERRQCAAVLSEDVFCSVVRMGYGKGGKNPVTELTTFYQPVRASAGALAAAAAVYVEVTDGPAMVSRKRKAEEGAGESVVGAEHVAVGLIPSGTSFAFHIENNIRVVLLRLVIPSNVFRGRSFYSIQIELTDSVSRLIPREFEEIYVRVFCRHGRDREVVDEAFDAVSAAIASI
jgi:hypothetical protein